MQQSASIIVVPCENMGSFPLAFQAYVRKFFAESTVLGRPCFVAAGAINLHHYVGKKGVAPIHGVDLMEYKEGLEGQSLSEWMNGATQSGLIWKFYESWDDGCRGVIEN